MIDAAANDALDAISSCPCCLLRPQQRSLKTPYTYLNDTEIYSDMLKECFNIELNVASDECGICEVCVGRLRDASNFKLQVQRSQVELQQRLARALKILEEEPAGAVKSDSGDEDGTSDNMSDEVPLVVMAAREDTVIREMADEWTSKNASTLRPTPGASTDAGLADDYQKQVDATEVSLQSLNVSVIAKHLACIQTGISQLQISQQEILQRLRSSSSTPLEHSLPDGITLPCDDNEALNTIETWIHSTENRKRLVTYLSLVGGNKVPALIRRILEKLFTNRLALLCNWTGKNGKTPLKELELIKIIRGHEGTFTSLITGISQEETTVVKKRRKKLNNAVRQNQIAANATDAEINEVISNWFRFTKDRNGGREARRLKL